MAGACVTITANPIATPGEFADVNEAAKSEKSCRGIVLLTIRTCSPCIYLASLSRAGSDTLQLSCLEQISMSGTATWDRYDIGRKVECSFAEVDYYRLGRRFDRSYVTPYQLEMMFRDRFPEDFESICLTIGGAGGGERDSLDLYLEVQLSRKVANDELPNIRGGFQSNIGLQGLSFNERGEEIVSSATDSQYDLSPFPLRPTDS